MTMVLKSVITVFDKAQGRCGSLTQTDITRYMGARAAKTYSYLMRIGCYSSGNQCLGWGVFSTDVH